MIVYNEAIKTASPIAVFQAQTHSVGRLMRKELANDTLDERTCSLHREELGIFNLAILIFKFEQGQV